MGNNLALSVVEVEGSFTIGVPRKLQGVTSHWASSHEGRARLQKFLGSAKCYFSIIAKERKLEKGSGRGGIPNPMPPQIWRGK